jgi:hypothetical protein
VQTTRRNITTILLSAAGSIATTSLASSADGLVKAKSASAGAGVGKAVEGLRKAMIEADKGGLNSLLSPQLSFGHSNGVVQTKAEFMDSVLGRKEVFKSIALTNQSIKAIGSSAVVRQTFASNLELEGKPLSVVLGELQVWQASGNGWQMIARQAFKV